MNENTHNTYVNRLVWNSLNNTGFSEIELKVLQRQTCPEKDKDKTGLLLIKVDKVKYCIKWRK